MAAKTPPLGRLEIVDLSRFCDRTKQPHRFAVMDAQMRFASLASRKPATASLWNLPCRVVVTVVLSGWLPSSA